MVIKMKQKKLYLDMTKMGDCTSIWVKDTEIIPAGTTIYSMSVKQKNEEYERFAKEYDIHFIFEDNMPVIDFYTIPRVDIFATDSNGGYLGTIGNMTDLESDAPICYIDEERRCYLIAKSAKEFLEKVSKWKINLKNCEEVQFYASKEAAMEENEFSNYEEMMVRRLDVQKFSKTYTLRLMTREDAELIYAMMRKNIQYYKYCGKQNVIEDVYNDLEITPPGKESNDKYYLGYFDEEELVAVLDIYDGFPDKETAYIGFFMMNIDYQGQGIGTTIVSELFEYLKEMKFERVRLGIDKDNPQSTHFWKKQGFVFVREVEQEGGIIVVADKIL